MRVKIIPVTKNEDFREDIESIKHIDADLPDNPRIGDLVRIAEFMGDKYTNEQRGVASVLVFHIDSRTWRKDKDGPYLQLLVIA